VMPLSEMETSSRGCSALDRDRASLEGVSRSRGHPILERGGASPVGATCPRARRSCTGAAPYPSSEAEFRPRVAKPVAWWAMGPWVYLARVFRFVCICFLRM
jgi:hypothetical protein